MRLRRRCTCDRQPAPRRRARVGGLCGFPDTAERVPARSRKTERRAAVQERCKNEKGDKMSTEFYCEEFPAEQNGKPVQTLKDLLEACPEDRFLSICMAHIIPVINFPPILVLSYIKVIVFQ